MTDIVEAVTDELLAHGEFSSGANNRSNARIAAEVVINIVRQAASQGSAGGEQSEVQSDEAIHLLRWGTWDMTPAARLDWKKRAEDFLAGVPDAAQCSQGQLWSASKHDEIIKRLMADIGYPNSQSIYGAFKQFANELHALTHSSTEVPAQAVPDGWKLVPILPTPRMVEVGCENNPTQWNEGTDDGFAADVANDVYVSMVGAAPSPLSSTDCQTHGDQS